MSNSSGFYTRVRVDGADRGVVSQAGGVLLARTVAAAGLDAALSEALGPWRKPLAVHDPAKVLLDLADHAPWTQLVTGALDRLARLTAVPAPSG